VAVLALGAAGAAYPASQPADAPRQARLVVTTQFVKTPAQYIEGAFYYLEVRKASDGSLVRRRRGEGKPSLSNSFPPGRYRIHAYARPCSGTCEQLSRPTDGCARALRLRAGTTVRAQVRFKTDAHCSIRL